MPVAFGASSGPGRERLAAEDDPAAWLPDWFSGPCCCCEEEGRELSVLGGWPARRLRSNPNDSSSGNAFSLATSSVLDSSVIALSRPL